MHRALLCFTIEEYCMSTESEAAGVKRRDFLKIGALAATPSRIGARVGV